MIDPSQFVQGAPGPPAAMAPAPNALQGPPPDQMMAMPEQGIPTEADPTDPQQFAAMLAQEVQAKLMEYAQMLDQEGQAKLAAAAQMAQEDMQQILEQVMETTGAGAATFDGPPAVGY